MFLIMVLFLSSDKLSHWCMHDKAYCSCLLCQMQFSNIQNTKWAMDHIWLKYTMYAFKKVSFSPFLLQLGDFYVLE